MWVHDIHLHVRFCSFRLYTLIGRCGDGHMCNQVGTVQYQKGCICHGTYAVQKTELTAQSWEVASVT